MYTSIHKCKEIGKLTVRDHLETHRLHISVLSFSELKNYPTARY